MARLEYADDYRTKIDEQNLYRSIIYQAATDLISLSGTVEDQESAQDFFFARIYQERLQEVCDKAGLNWNTVRTRARELLNKGYDSQAAKAYMKECRKLIKTWGPDE